MSAPAISNRADPRPGNRSAARDSGMCFHCGEPNPPRSEWHLALGGVRRRFCCAGCLAVAQTLQAAGLDDFYAQRTASAERADTPAEPWTHYDAAVEARGIVQSIDSNLREAPLLLEGIRCSACIRLIETWLQRQPGVVAANVNFATHRARVRWDARTAKLSDLLRAIAAIGYRGYPYDARRREALARRESRALFARMAVALLAMMQVMMFAVPAYVSVDGVEREYQRLFDWASLLLTLPVVVYSAAPIFHGAWRDLRLPRLGMDVPVALGIAGAFAASAWATTVGTGAVYYDSLTMFVALLLVARYVELRARQKSGEAIEAVARELPQTAGRMRDYPHDSATDTVAAESLAPGDHICVAAGSPVAADGIVVDGHSHVEEAILTGESWPRAKAAGDAVLAGSVNRESPLIVRVTAAGEATTLAALARLVERGASQRPRIARMADRCAGWFVGALLLIAAATAFAWWHVDPAQALVVTFAVLVVSCPCALSLATPAAIAAAAGALGRRHILALRPDAVEALSRVTHVVFDKTGTLTAGHVRLTSVTALGRLDREACLAVASALQQGSTHPIAAALRAAALPAMDASDIRAVSGCGVEATIAGQRYRCGRPEWISPRHRGASLDPAPALAGDESAAALADDSGWLAWFTFSDPLRSDAPALVDALKKNGIAVSLVSGDRAAAVAHVAAAVGIADCHGEVSPDDKRAFVEARQREGAVVAMIGDGINDAPSLAQADVSLSLGSASALAQWTADIVVLGDDMMRIAEAVDHSRWTFRVIRQNLAWALAYNLIAIPLAATGELTPLAAALGMSLSSVLVVANSLRVARTRRAAHEGARSTKPIGGAAAQVRTAATAG